MTDLSFLTEGFFGHLSYILLIISSLMRRMLWLRLFVMGSALAGIIFDGLVIGNSVGAFWQVLLLAVNVVQVALIWTRDRRAKFTPEERDLITRWMSSGTPGQRRMLLDFGRWETLEAGQALTTSGHRPRYLTYLAEGGARLGQGEAEIGAIQAGHFIGEMSLMGDGLATADVEISGEARVWRIERQKLDRLRETQPQLFGLIESAIALNLRAKVIDGNRKAAGAR